ILFASAFAYIHFFQGTADIYFFSSAAVLSIALSAAGGFMVSRNVTAPVTQLVAMAKKIQKGETDFAPPAGADEEIGYLQKSFISFSKVLGERELMKSTFSRYISDYIADEILTEDLATQFLAEYRNVTILFSDIRGFTTLSETLEPKDLFDVLNHYFDQMIDIVIKNNGVINKFIGDAIMVLYNAPRLCENADIMAIITAVEMNRRLAEFNLKHTRKYGVTLGIGVGINSGQVVAGNIGSEKRMEYTVIGDTVNVSSRLQSVAKAGEIVISENIFKSAQYVFELSDMGEIELKGKRQPLRVYKVAGELTYEKIKENLKSDDPEVLQLSLIALGRVEKLSLETDLMPLLKNGFEKIRFMALELIIEKFKAKAEECIMYVLQNDKSEFVKVFAIDKIGALGLSRFANFLAQQYLAANSLRLKGAVINCLYNLKEPRLKERIISQCAFENKQVMDEVKKYFEKYSKLDLYETLETMLSENASLVEQKLAVYLLCNLGLSTKAELLNKMFRDCRDDELRKLVVAAFLKIGSCRSVIFLLKNLNKFEKEILNNAYKVIAHLIGKYHAEEYKHDLSVQIQLDIIKSLILSSEGKNFEKLKVALIKNK
ncbi:MAG TPA: adenylate/guanylate cyclase domain-containing protein, partial [Candidatus Wallbacteria bacterium]|nr:adenylate/guanylate cyclase domain-containing protein [Candidatus Wallbacteria bacterium]